MSNVTTVAIIFSLEPVFAALFGFPIGDETLSLFGWVGCGLIFAAILITVLKNTNINKINHQNLQKLQAK